MAKVHHLSINKENKPLFSERNTVIISEKSKVLKMSSVFLNLQQSFVKHCLTIWLMMNGDVTKAKN